MSHLNPILRRARRWKKPFGAVLTLTLVATAAVRGQDHVAVAAGPTPAPYAYGFDGAPATPTPFRPANWDIVTHSRNKGAWKAPEPMHGMHGSDCAGPPAQHEITEWDDTVFQCRNHMMTSIKAGGYGAIYLTPGQMVDFAGGEARISFDLSTMRTSTRDWVDLWITPFASNLVLPMEDWIADGQGLPREGVHVRMDTVNGNTVFKVRTIKNFAVQDIKGNWWKGYESVLKPDPARRDTFELRLSRTHVAFGMPAYNLWWVDANIQPLDWTRGVVQLGHHSYNPGKDCPTGKVCGPNTWHWDNLKISAAVPFGIVRAEQRFADPASGCATFPVKSPANAHLRFSGIGGNLQVSVDGGRTWQAATRQAQKGNDSGRFSSYWMPVPAGVSTVQFRGSAWYGGSWFVKDVSLWSEQTVEQPEVTGPAKSCTIAPAPFTPPAGAAAFDSFTDTAGKTLQQHKGQTGAAWTRHPASTSDAVISVAGRIRTTADAGARTLYTASVAPSSGQYRVSADVVVVSKDGTAPGVTARTSETADTYYLARYNGGNGRWELYRFVNGTGVVLSSFAQSLTAGQTYRLTLQVGPASQQVLVDGALRITAADASITSVGRPGLRWYGSQSDTTGYHLDNVVVENGPLPAVVEEEEETSSDLPTIASPVHSFALDTTNNSFLCTIG
jgi:hypothetical protein